MDNKKPGSSAGGKRTGGGAYGKKPGGGGGKPQGRFGKPSGSKTGGKSFGSKPRAGAGGKPKFRSEARSEGRSQDAGGYKRKFDGEGSPENKNYGPRSGSGKFAGSGTGKKPYARSGEGGGYEGRSTRARSGEGGGYEGRSTRARTGEVGGYEGRSTRARTGEGGGYEGRASRGRPQAGGGYEERKARERAYEERSQGQEKRPYRPTGAAREDGGVRTSGYARSSSREGGYGARAPRERNDRDQGAQTSDDPNLVFLKMNISKDLVQRAKELAADNEMSLTDFLPKLFEVAVNSMERSAYRKRTYVTEAPSQNRKSIKTWRPKED